MRAILENIVKSLERAMSSKAATLIAYTSFFCACLSFSYLAYLELSDVSLYWDLQHELYFAEMLRQGDLLWVKEYHDKLPVVQFVTFAAISLGHAIFWEIGSFVLLLVSGFVLATIYRLQNDNAANSTFCAIFLFYVTLSLSLPYGLATLNAPVIGLQSLALGLYALAFMRSRARPNASKGLIAASLLATAIAVSIRPYLLVSHIVFIALVPFLTNADAFRSFSKNLKLGAVSVLALGFVCITINFGPYLVTGNFSNALFGMQFLLAETNPTSGYDRLISFVSDNIRAWFFTFTTLFVVALWVGLTLLGAQIKSIRNTVTKWIPLVLVSYLIVTLLTMLAKHFWDHYLVLFIAPVILILLMCIKQLDQSKLTPQWREAFKNIVLVSSAVGTLFFASSAYQMNQDISISNISIKSRVSNIRDFLAQQSPSDTSFLDAQNMYSHYALQEPRHGFPHASNVGHIIFGWWQSAPQSDLLFVPRTIEELCAGFETLGPHWIFSKPDDEISKCLAISTAYQQESQTLDDGDLIFERK